MNKNAKTSPWLIVGGVLLIGILGLLVYGVMQSTRTSEEIITAGGCEFAPTVTVNTVNSANKGTAVSETVNAVVGGVSRGVVTEGTTEFAKGEKVTLMLNASNFIDVILPEITIVCGANNVNAEMYATSTNTFRIFNTGNNQLTNAVNGGTTNQTASASAISLQVFIDGTIDESTGDLVIVIEASNTTEVDDIVLSGFPGATKTDVPEFYSVNVANSLIRAYKVDQILGTTESGTLALSPESGITMGTGDLAVYVTAYSEQAFIDTDGSFQTGVENNKGTLKYEDTWDFDFSIGNV